MTDIQIIIEKIHKHPLKNKSHFKKNTTPRHFIIINKGCNKIKLKKILNYFSSKNQKNQKNDLEPNSEIATFGEILNNNEKNIRRITAK